MARYRARWLPRWVVIHEHGSQLARLSARESVRRECMSKLPLVESHRKATEQCTYCPKLCRSACPVSNAEPREVLIPWGKMMMTGLAHRGEQALNEPVAQLAWACSGCGGCQAFCEHKTPVAETLLEARHGYFQQGLAPKSARQVIEHFTNHLRRTARAIDRLSVPEHTAPHGAPLLLGCAYARALPEEAADAIRAVHLLSGRSVRLLRGCCGQPLRDAGDLVGAARALDELRSELRGEQEVLVLDPGCARRLRETPPSATPSRTTSTVRPLQVRTVVELVFSHLGTLRLAPRGPRETRYHDPCHLGRGLGLYAEPRAILERVLGAAPKEFLFHHESSACSGAGGLLPRTFRQTSRVIAHTRVQESNERGGGPIVTACASSLLAFRRAGADASDLISWVARSLQEEPPTGSAQLFWGSVRPSSSRRAAS